MLVACKFNKAEPSVVFTFSPEIWVRLAVTYTACTSTGSGFTHSGSVIYIQSHLLVASFHSISSHVVHCSMIHVSSDDI